MATEREAKVQGFRRINFFRGFLTTEHDWNDAERYHLEKRKLHNRLCHAPGVVLGHAGELRVHPRTRGDFSIEIEPGYAIDGQGNDLILWETQIKTLVPEEYKLPQTLYIVLRFVEELTDFIAYKENLEYKGHRRVLESCRVELSQTPPDIRKEVELGRILLEKNATQVRDARDPNDPKANELDLRFVPRAGVAGSSLEPVVRLRIQEVLRSARKALFHLARDGKVQTAHDGLAAVLSASMMLAADQLDLRNLFEVFSLLTELSGEIAVDIELNHPSLAQRKEFTDFRKQIAIQNGILSERHRTTEALTSLGSYVQKGSNLLDSLFSSGTPSVGDEPPASTPVPTKGGGWEAVKSMGLLELPAELEVDGRVWSLVDSIDVMNKASEEAHALIVQDAKDAYRSRQKLKYPDGNTIEDVGRAHVGGFTQYQVKNVRPGQELAIVRRMDYVYGDYEIEYVIEGRSAGICSCAGTDRVHRWRNWPYVIGADLVTKDRVTIKQIATNADRDVNMFRYWFYQPK